MGKGSKLFEQWGREYAEDAEYIAYGLLTDITADICAAMEAQGMTRKELAEKLDVSPQYVTKFLNTPENTSVYQVVRFAQAVGLDVEVLLRPHREQSEDNAKRTTAGRRPAGDTAGASASREAHAR
jgi:transcriptional regulator with XRE-family HTH domain